MRGIFRDLDMVIASLVLCASSAVAALAYATIQQREAPTGVLVSSIKSGTHAYRILFGESCPGDFQTTLLHDSVWLMRGAGNFRSSYGRAIVDLAITTEAQFNPLGQLQKAQLAINSDAVNFSVGLSNANPIAVQIDRTIAGETTSQRLSLPGPIRIIPTNHPNEYAITYPGASLAQHPTVKALQGLLSHELRVAVVGADAAPATCHAQPSSRLDLLPVTIQLQSFFQPFMNLAISGKLP
jgi:hypothetical protein